MLTLYHDPVSTHSWKVRLVLAEKGLPYEEVVFDVRHARDHKAPVYLAIHPYGKVPAIVEDGFAIYDSTTINEYLEERYPEVPLLPPDPRDRARLRMLEDFRDNHFHSDFFPLLRQLRDTPPDKRDASVVESAKAAVFEDMARLEAAAEGREYLCGGFSIADAAFIPNFAYLEQWHIAIPDSYPRLHAWWKRCKARPSYTAAYGL